MSGKITSFLREYVFGLSIIFTILGFVILFLSISYYAFDGLGIDFVNNLEDWNLYILIFGFVVFAWFGVYYLYSFLTNRKFVLEELETNKRSEFLKKHSQVKIKVKHLPSKYQKMLKDKEKELKIK